MFGRAQFRFYALTVLSLVAAGCTQAPNNESSILDQVNIYLSQGDCSDALNILLPYYNTANSDNDVRMAMAEVYACEAGFNFFGFLGTAESVNFDSSGALFELFAKEFPSSGTNIGDKVVESAGFGIDALMASIQSGIVLVPGDLFNSTTNNPGSLLWTDRTSDSNQYLLFLTMAAMGGLENRVGAVSGTGKPTNTPALPWVTASTNGMVTAAGLDASGCEFASALVNFADVMAQLSEICPANPPSTDIPCLILNTLNTAAGVDTTPAFAALHATSGAETFSQAIYDACNYGCTDTAPSALPLTGDGPLFNAVGSWQKSGCTVTGLPSCDQCPILLRNRGNCAGTTTDEVSCAAAGIINFVNNSLIGWQ